MAEYYYLDDEDDDDFFGQNLSIEKLQEAVANDKTVITNNVTETETEYVDVYSDNVEQRVVGDRKEATEDDVVYNIENAKVNDNLGKVDKQVSQSKQRTEKHNYSKQKYQKIDEKGNPVYDEKGDPVYTDSPTIYIERQDFIGPKEVGDRKRWAKEFGDSFLDNTAGAIAWAPTQLVTETIGAMFRGLAGFTMDMAWGKLFDWIRSKKDKLTFDIDVNPRSQNLNKYTITGVTAVYMQKPLDGRVIIKLARQLKDGSMVGNGSKDGLFTLTSLWDNNDNVYRQNAANAQLPQASLSVSVPTLNVGPEIKINVKNQSEVSWTDPKSKFPNVVSYGFNNVVAQKYGIRKGGYGTHSDEDFFEELTISAVSAGNPVMTVSSGKSIDLNVI